MLKIIKFAEEKGIEQGEGKGMSEIIYKQLLFKFKDIPVEYQEKLQEQDKEKLEIIGMKIMEMQQLTELAGYLGIEDKG